MRKFLRSSILGFTILYASGLTLMASDAEKMIRHKISNQESSISIPSLPKGYITNHTYDDVLWLARNIYFESRGEPEEGKLAVAFVTINRMMHPGFPSGSIKAVVVDRTPRGACEFSWVCQRSPDSVYELSEWNKAVSLASKVLRGEVKNPIGDAIFFRTNKGKKPLEHEKVIARHVFSEKPISR